MGDALILMMPWFYAFETRKVSEAEFRSQRTESRMKGLRTALTDFFSSGF
jgi:hypothetical protein